MKLLYKVGFIVFIFYLFVCLYIYFIQASLIFFPEMPDRRLHSNPSSIDLEYENVNLTTDDGVSIHSWFIPNNKTPVTILFSHGNAGNIADRLDSIRIFYELGLNILIYDYRGYGQSTGKISEAGTYLDNRAAWDYLLQVKKIPPEHIILFGRSLGAAMASQLAGQVRPGAVILESASTSIPDMAAALYPWLPIRWLTRFKYDNLRHVQGLSSPVLVVHSQDDELIPYSHGQQIFAQAPEPKMLLTLQGGHNDGFMLSYVDYSIGLQTFLRRYMPAYRPVQ